MKGVGKRGRGAVWRALVGVGSALAGVAFAHAAAAHNGAPDWHQRLYNPHMLDQPRIVSRPASGDTYYPGETITVYVPWGRTQTRTSISVNSVATVQLVLTVGGAQRTLTGIWEDRSARYGPAFTIRRLYFDYVVQAGDRDTDGVSLAENALSSPGNAESGIRGTAGTSFRQFELEKLLHGFGAQSGHKVDTPAPSFAGVSSPSLILYSCGAFDDCGSASHRLPTLSNAAEAHNVTYSVTPARPLPSGLVLDSSTATITGSHSAASARQSYTLRATDGFNRTADLTFNLEVRDDVGIESITVTSNPGSDKTYGKNGDFGTNDTIIARVDFSRNIGSIIRSNVCLNIRIGSNTRRVCNPTGATRQDKLDFSYAVVEGDWDGDGISFPANPMGAGKSGYLRFYRAGIGGGDNRIDRSFGAVLDDPNHKVRGRQTLPSFGTTASPAFSWVKDNAVSQVLPAATGGDGGLTYSIEEGLPDGLVFAAATRTLSGTPTAVQGAANYTLVATDGDGDKTELRFSIEIREIVLSISSPSVSEGAAGGTATLPFAVTLNRAPGRQVTVDWAAAADPGTAASGADYTAFSGGTLTFAATDTSKTVEVTVTGDALDEPDETIRIALSNPSGAVVGSAATGVGTITDDDPTPTLTLALSDPDAGRPDTIRESGAGNATTVTASLAGGTSGEAITVTVSAASTYAALAADGGFALSTARTLTIAVGQAASAGAVTIAATDDIIDSADKTATVSGAVAGGHGLVAAPAALTLTIADEDSRPSSALALAPASISESGGVATVTATLSHPSAEAVTIAVSATASTGAVDGDFALSAANTLTVAAGRTTSAGVVTVTAVGNGTDSPDKQVTVTGSASGTLGAADPPDATLTLRDDDGPPTVSLVLSSSSIAENGGVATVSAALGGASSEAVTVTVAASAVAASGAVAGDFGLSGTTLTIAANATTSTGTVTITASDNDVDAPDKRVTVSGTAAGVNGVADPANATLTLADDEALPTATLALAPASIAEAGGLATVTATLSGESSAATTLTVTAAAGAHAAAGDFTLSAAATLTIAAGETASAGTVTVAAVADTTDSPDKLVAVGATAAGGNGIADPAAATLTVTDDDALPTLTLTVSPSTIDESGAGSTATVTAALSHPSSEAVTVTVSAVAVVPADSGDFSVSAANTLTIAAGATTSVGAVTVAAVDDRADAPDKRVTVRGAASGGRGAANPADATLTIADDEALPTVALALSSTSISETGGISTVTATLSGASSAAVTVTVAAAAGTGAVAGDFTLSTATTLTFAAGSTTSAGLVTVTANGNVVDSPNKSVTVSGTAAGGHGVAAPPDVTLTLEDDDALPTVALALSDTSISETGGVSTVTATLSGLSSAAVTVTVAAAAGAGAVAADFTLSTATTLTIAAGATTSAGEVTVTANGNAVDSPNKSVTVSGTAAGGNGVANPPNVTLTLTDDDALPTVALALSSTSISETGGISTVTATLSGASSAAVTVTVAAAAGTGAVVDDFTLSTATTLTFAANATTSTGLVTVTANGNVVDSPNKSVTISGTAAGGHGVAAPSDVTLTLEDDDATATATLVLTPSSILENGEVSTVTATLSHPTTEATTLTVAAAAGANAVAADFTLSTAATLTIAAGATTSAGLVTVTANDNALASGMKTVTVSATAVGGRGVADPSDATLTIRDDEYGLDVSAVTGQATEAGGTATFTVVLQTQPSAAVTVSVASRDTGEGTVGPSSLTFTTGNWSTAQTVTVTGVQDTIDDGPVTWQVRLDPASGDADYDGLDNVDVDVTTTDDDGAPGVTLSLAPASIAESGTGNVSTVTARLSHASGAATTVTVTAVSGLYAVGTDAAIVIPAGSTQAASDTATVVAVDNTTDEPDRTGTVTATIANARAAEDSTTMAVTGAALTVRDDDSAPTATLALAPASVAENGGIATVSATLSHPSSEPSTVTVATVSGAYTVGTDATITIAAGATTAASDTVLVTAVDDSIHQGSAGRSVTVTAALANGHGAGAVTGAALTLSDDETLPTVALVLSSSSITETGGIATVTARLSGPSSAAVTVTVGAAAGTGAVAADFDLSSATTLTFAAGATTSAGVVTVTANGNVVDSPNKSVTVSGTAAGGNGVANPPNVTLTLEDDDALPTVALALSASSITETGGISTVTATLSGPSSEAVTVTVGAAAGAGAVAADFTLSTAATLTFAAGSTTSAGLVTVTANGNAVDSPNKSVTVSGTAAGGNSVANPPNVTLTLEDDDALPTVALALSASSITETGGVSTVTARLSGPSSAAVTVTVAAAAGAGAVAADFTLSTAATLTFAAGATASTGLVTVTANGNDVDSPNKPVTVSGAAAGGNGVSNPPNVTLTLTDDDALPTVALALSDTSITETGGVSTVTARLSGKSSAAVTVTVAATAGSGAVAADFTQSGTTLTIAAGATTSAGEVTVTANGNAVDSPNKPVTVSGTAAGGNGVSNPSNVTLTLTDDDALPTVSLALAPSSIAETNGVATVTARLSGASSAAVTVTVAAAAGTGTVAADFTLSSATTLTIAAGSTESAGLVTVTANGNDVDSPNKTVTVSGAAAGGNNVANPSNVTLTLADDDALPTLALVLTPATVGENGGVSTVTATLSGKSSAAVTLTVSAAAVASTGAVAGDFALSSATTLTIAAGATVSAGTVTVTANDNAADEPDVEVRVSATAAGGNSVAPPPAATLTIRDDEGSPTVTLALTPATIDESGTGSTAAVTATLNRASSAATTVTVSVAPVAATGAAAGDYTLSSPATLTIAANATTSSGTVTVAAVDNDTDAPNKQATVSGTAVNDQGVQQPIARTLTIADDDAAPDATLALSATSISENGGMATVTATLSRRSAQATTVTVQGVAGAYSVGSGAASRIVIAAGATSSGGGAALAAVDNDVDAADRQVTVTAVLANGHGVGTVSGGGVALTLTDDDTAGLAVDPATSTTSRLETTESAGTATFTVKLATEPTGDVEIGVASSNTAEGTVGPSTLAFTTTNWSTAQTVTLTGVDDSAADGNRDYTVTLTIDQTNTADSNYDALPAVTVYARNRDNEFGLNVSAVSGQATEGGGQSTFTVALRTQPAAAVTVSVTSRDAGEGSVSPPSLTFTTGGWNTAQTVTVTGVQDTIDDGTVTWQVRLDPASGDGDYGTSSVEEDVSVTTTDDDGPPGVTLTLNPASIAESGTGNAATVTARLSHPSGAATTVTVTAVSGFFTAGSGAAGTIVIPAGQMAAATDTALVTAVDNTTDEPDRTETVTAAIANARATTDGTTMSVTGAALTVRDDDAAPGVVLALDPASVSENGGLSTVTATLSHPSSQPSTVTVAGASGLYTVGSDATITIAAGSTTAASDTVLVTAVDDSIHQGTAGRSVTVTASLANGHGAGAVTGAALTLTDDETLPTVALVPGPASISEEGGVSTVTATLSGPSSAAVTVTVAAAAVSPAVAGDFALSTATTLTIAAGATTSTGAVTIRANGNAVASGSKSVTVTGTAAGGNGVANPANATLTITDDDAPQTTLVLSSSSIAENGGVATVTATLDRQSTVAVTVTVAAAAVSPAVAGDFTQSGTALTFAANATTSTGLVTVTAVNNTTDAPDKSVTVSGTASDSLGQTNDPPSATLAITDDDAAPTATLALNPSSVTENDGISTVSATLSHPSSQPSTVTVTGASGLYTVGSDATIVIAAGATTAASDTVLVTAVNDDIHQGSVGRSATVTASLANGQGAGVVTGAALTLTDDETLPTASLVLGPASISENGGVSTVTARLSGASSQPTTVTVSTASSSDYTQTGTTLTIAAGSTTSAGTVTVTGNDNNVDAANKQVTVSATAAGGNGVANPAAATLTLADDEATATATLVLTPAAILENEQVSTVTARLSHPTTEAVTLTVSTTAGARAVAANFDLSSATTLTIAANATTSTGLVTVTANDDNDATGNKQVRVSATAAGGHGVAAPSDATLIIRDDEVGLDVSVAAGLTVTEAGGTATFTVRLNAQPSAAVTVSVTSQDPGEGRVEPSSLVFTTGNWNTAQTVTVTGVDDNLHDGNVTWQVRLDPASGDGDYNTSSVEEDVSVTTTDAAPPEVTLMLEPASISEDGGVSTVTARLSHPSSADTTVTVEVSPVSPDDYTLSMATMLTIAATATKSTGVVTIRARDNRVDAADKTVTVSGSAANSLATDGTTLAVTAATLTIVDDDEKGFVFDPAALVVAAGGSTSWTVKLTSEPDGGDVTVSISPDNADLTVSHSSLTFMATNWNEAQAVTVTAARTAGVGEVVPLAHTASGGDYRGVAKDLWVAGEATANDEIKTTGAPGPKFYVVDGQPVTVTETEGVPPGVRVEPLSPLAGPLDVKVTLLTPEDAKAAAGSRYRLGEEGKPGVAVNVEVPSVPEDGLRLCLPVTADLRKAADGRGLELLRNGSVVPGSEPVEEGGQVIEVCAGLKSFSPFAVGYLSSKPSFAAVSRTTYTFTVDEAQTETLPKAEGYGRMTYRLKPAAPPGLKVDADAGTLSGTPTEPMKATPYEWFAKNGDGDESDPILITIEVVPALGLARERLAAVNRSVLPELARAMWGSVVDAVTGRLESSGAGSGMADTLASALKAQEDAQEGEGLSWREVVEGRTFAVALGGGSGGGAGAGSGVGGSGSGGAGAVMWGGGSRRSLSLDKESLDWSGDLFSAHVGVDAPLGEGLRGGLALSWFEGEIDYTDRSGDEAVAGAHESRLTAVHPYAGWSGADGSRLWGALGYGEGEVEIADAEVRERFGVQKGDSAFVGVAAGGSVPVASANGLALALKGSGEATRYSVKDNGLALAAVSVKTQRLRLAAEGSRTWALTDGGTLTPALEVGARWDGGDGETGAGVELGGGLEWTLPSQGLAVEARGRTLAAHEGDVEEWGVSGSARLSPGSGGRGLSLTLSPRWGASESGLARLWDEGMTGRASSDADTDAARLEAEVGYGYGFWERSGVMTPHAGFDYEESGARRWRLGTRFTFGPDLAVGLQAERKEGPATPEHGVGLELRLRW